MEITRTSIIDNKSYTMDLPLSMEEFERGIKAYNDGAFIQHAFPTLNAEQREFLLNGITPEEWNTIFADYEE